MTSRLINEPCDIVVFGGAGDLARRKLLPALYHLDRQDRLPASTRIVGLVRSADDVPGYAERIEAACRETIAPAEFTPAVWQRFAQRLHCMAFDLANPAGYASLATALGDGHATVRVFYFAVHPDLFGTIAGHLAAAGLLTPSARLVLEKPLGRDLPSSHAINTAIGSVASEDRIYRIDHYLGKETVQNLMVLRFANSLFEPLWNRTYIDHVQITVAETVGSGGRWGFYDQAGALRDMVQNHMLQLLCLTAMEPPNSLDADAVRDEKVKVLRALVPITGSQCQSLTVRGQYRSGTIAGQPVPGYLDEPDARGTSDTETFVALRAGIDNWRWSGVPFYLRTGKRLPQRTSEIVVQFHAPPHFIYPRTADTEQANRLLMRLQPNEGVRLVMLHKQPGPGDLRLRQAALNLSFADAFGAVIPDAYERLLLDVIRGRPALFMRLDEVEAAWRFTDGVRRSWEEYDMPVKLYAAGTWGPTPAVALIERDGRTWHEDDG